MQYSPPLRKTSFIVVLIIGILLILSPPSAQAFPKIKNIFTLSAGVFLLAILLLSARFLLSRFYYRLDGKQLVVIRRIGKQVTTLCRLHITRMQPITDIPPVAAGKKRQYLNACQNLFPHKVCRLLFEEDDTEIIITLECDHIFKQALHNIESKTKSEVANYDQ